MLCRVYSDPRPGMQYTFNSYIFLTGHRCFINGSSIISNGNSWLTPVLGTALREARVTPVVHVSPFNPCA